MKLINILLAICIIAVANTVSAQDDTDNDDDLSSLLKEAPALDTKAINNNFVEFYLSTRRNPNTRQRIIRNQNSIRSSNFIAANRNVIIIHDWDSNYQDRLNTGLTNAFLQKADHNIISVYWRAANSPYPRAVDAIDPVAKRIALLIDFLNTQFGPLGFLQLFGHGVGAHIAGSVGQQLVSGRLGKIVGLDPSRPLINFDNPDRHLSPDDALYVETVQTNGGHWGWDRPLGKANFFPNGGREQPSCSGQNINWCSHWRSVDYCIQSLLFNNYKSKRCPTAQDAHLGTCESDFSTVRLCGPNNYSRGVSGNFNVPVHAKSPYGAGDI